jgi:hypothetical protein
MKAATQPFAALAGRDNELAILVARREPAGAGEGGVAFIGGEPGIGKDLHRADTTTPLPTIKAAMRARRV